jgi:catechol 2,3-dioxygenase-like lactoylglutathione lyase family enzyme
MILGVNHVAISVPDMEKALAFYRDLLGFEKVFEFSWGEKSDLAEIAGRILAVKGTVADVIVLRADNMLIELFKFKAGGARAQDPNRPVIDHGFTHLCLAVKDLDKEYDRLKAAGMKFHCPPTQVVEGVRTIYGRDPFGNVIELEEAEGRELAMQPAVSG